MLNAYQMLKDIKNSVFEVYAGVLKRSIVNERSQHLQVSPQPMIVFAPHQDDETFGCAGLMALKRQLGVSVVVVFLTDGAFYQVEDEKAAMCQIRQDEALQALDAVGVAANQVHFLDYPDGSLTDLFNSADRELVLQRIMQLIQGYDGAEIYVPYAHDWHPDHEMTYQFVQAAIARLGNSGYQLWQYPVWAFWQMSPRRSRQLYQQEGWHWLSIQSVLERKKVAISAYRSQYSILPHAFMRFYQRPVELFLAPKSVQ
jgi:N-acetylglucosamine malate deacetylase 1